MKRSCLIIIAYLGFCIYLATTGHWWWLLIVLLLGIIVAFFFFAAYALEAGFRDKFPLDFIVSIGWVNDFFVQKGFDLLEHRGAGSDYPESVLAKDGIQVIVRLNAPLLTTKQYSITVFINNGVEKEWTFAVDADRKQVFRDFEEYLDI